MCNPTLAVAVFSAAASYGSQRSNQRAMLKAQQQASNKETERYQKQAAAERINEQFEAEQRAKEIEAASSKVRAARATARTAAAEAGVAGNSVDLLLDEYSRQGAALKLGLKRQGDKSSVVRELRVADIKLASEQNQLRINQPVAGIDYGGIISSGIATGTSVGSAWNDYKSTKASGGNP